MSSLSDDPLIDDYTHNILEQIMKTEEGKMIVRQIKGQIKEISDTYKFLKDDNKEELEILRNKIRESIEQLKENMDAAHQYTDFGFLAVLAVLVSLVFFCYFCYRMYNKMREQKRLEQITTTKEKKKGKSD